MQVKSPESGWVIYAKDYIAASSRAILAISFGISIVCGYIAYGLMPALGNDIDPGLILLLGFGLPVAISAISLMIWARKWKRKRRPMKKPY